MILPNPPETPVQPILSAIHTVWESYREAGFHPNEARILAELAAIPSRIPPPEEERMLKLYDELTDWHPAEPPDDWRNNYRYE